MVISNPAGSVKIRPGDSTVVVVKERWLLEEPDVSISVADKVLRIEVTCPPFNDTIEVNTCTVDFSLVVPPGGFASDRSQRGQHRRRGPRPHEQLLGRHACNISCVFRTV